MLVYLLMATARTYLAPEWQSSYYWTLDKMADSWLKGPGLRRYGFVKGRTLVSVKVIVILDS